MSYVGLTPGALEAWPADMRELAFEPEECRGILRGRRAGALHGRGRFQRTDPEHVLRTLGSARATSCEMRQWIPRAQAVNDVRESP